VARVEAKVETEQIGMGNVGDAARAAGDAVPRIGGNAHDLAEAESDDGKIVATDTQCDQAKEDAAQHRGKDRNGNRFPEVQIHWMERRGAGYDCGRVRPYRPESRITQVKQTREPNDDVQTHRQQHVYACHHDDRAEVGRSDTEGLHAEDPQSHDNDDRQQLADEPSEFRLWRLRSHD
jgi:hypothetical protein